MKFHAYSTASPVSVIATTFVCKMRTAPVCVLEIGQNQQLAQPVLW